MSEQLPNHLSILQDPTVQQTCQILQVSNATIWRLQKKGVLEGYNVGKSRRIKLESIQALRGDNNE
jgi:excisionase family DNA binding protein